MAYIPDSGDTTTVMRMMNQLNDFLRSPTASETFSLKTPADTPRALDARSARKRRAEELDAKSSLLVAGAEKARLEAEVNDLKLSLKRSRMDSIMSPSRPQDDERVRSLREELACLRKENERLQTTVADMDRQTVHQRREVEAQRQSLQDEVNDLRAELEMVRPKYKLLHVIPALCALLRVKETCVGAQKCYI